VRGLAVLSFVSQPSATETAIPSPSRELRPAATLILLRDAPDGLEVLMVRRAAAASVLGGAYVFPGGAIDDTDRDAGAAAYVDRLDDRAASERLALRTGGLAYWIAAVRETFEEAGVLLARHRDGSSLRAEVAAAVHAARAALCARAIDFARLLASHDLVVDAHELVYFDHWITPPIRPRRFDTRFFVARQPDGQQPLHDSAETTETLWTPPARMVGRSNRGDAELAVPTRSVLESLARFASVDDVLAQVRSQGPIRAKRPCVAQGVRGERLFRPGDAPYHEIRWSDPHESMQTSYDLVPGVAKRLDGSVVRVIAPNPGAMTGPGTNTYLVGTDALGVIDPGPAIDAHVEAILRAAHAPIRWVLCTHSHRDHSPAAAAVSAATGAVVIGRPPPDDPTQDRAFSPSRIAVHDDRLVLGSTTLRMLHTPGHASNHVCYLLTETGMLFTGDHVMQGSTVVINPPDGDLRAYLRSLEMLLGIDMAIIAPGHGYLIGEPHDEIRRILRHREWREARIVEAVRRMPGARLDALVDAVYAEVDPRVKHAAARSLLAHLIKLQADGIVMNHDDTYTIAAR
jgi:glyoxylase-like metal-dependent hydrolase (beta-lactamase superfamily II)/8-oxo-dGTP pyrophosphatase MutT (NUDIX family)